MAKANKTAIEMLIEWWNDEGQISEMESKMKDMLAKERQQIENAFNNGAQDRYKNADHYYFMEYIDND